MIHCTRRDFLLRSLSLAVLSIALTGHAFGADDFPAPTNSEPDTKTPLTPAAAAATGFKVPDGFKVTLAAAEPDVQNPIGLAWDSRGRMWIAENYTYAERKKKFELKLRDRVLVLEDADGDGRFEKRTVFADNIQMLTSVEVGHGGVWLMCPPQLLFIPDRNGDDKADGAAEVVLDGFDVPPENYHNFANGLRWGPDGWLYGRCGASSPGKIGLPGTPAAKRVPLTGGMWRYHPKQKTVDVLCHGTTNPWGHDWNEFGDLFFINTVNGHLWHSIPGAHFVRPHTIDPCPYAYTALDMHADHWHFDTGKGWTASRDGKADSLGGGHAHEGLMIYQGDNWPAQYRGKLFTINLHGRRLNQENLVREGGGYVGKHGPDFAISDDKWFRGIDVCSGPDGGVFVLDWSDIGECHDSTGVHRTSGRIFKITYGTPPKPTLGDLTKLSVADLVKLQTHTNNWFARMARQQLADRVAAALPLDNAATDLRKLFDSATEVPIKLRALWSLNIVGAADDAWLRTLLRHDSEHVRAWALRLLTDGLPLDTVVGERNPQATPALDAIAAKMSSELVRMANEDQSALVRLNLASTLQRLPYDQRAAIATPLLARDADANDHNIPLMLWYGLIPLGKTDPDALAAAGASCKIPVTRRLIARRLGESIDAHPATVEVLLNAALKGENDAFTADILNGLNDGFVGKRKAAKPAAWDALSAKLNAGKDAALQTRVRELSVFFGDGRALNEVKALALNGKADLNNRRAALLTLIENKPPDLRQICEQMLGTRFLNTVAAKGLALFDDPAIGKKIASSYKNFHPSERAQVIETLVSRASFASALLEEIAAGRIARSDVTPFNARQIRNLGDEALLKRLSETWGELNESDAERKTFMARLKAQLSPETLDKADKSEGRLLFSKSCASCHKLYGEGGTIGPDLTGAGRDNMDYLIENIADPSAVVNADFRMTIVALNDGRVLNGIIVSKTEAAITLQTMTERVTLDTASVKKIKESTQSLMPQGLLETIKPEQVRDLFAYLMHRTQVPLPEGGEKK